MKQFDGGYMRQGFFLILFLGNSSSYQHIGVYMLVGMIQ